MITTYLFFWFMVWLAFCAGACVMAVFQVVKRCRLLEAEQLLGEVNAHALMAVSSKTITTLPWGLVVRIRQWLL